MEGAIRGGKLFGENELGYCRCHKGAMTDKIWRSHKKNGLVVSTLERRIWAGTLSIPWHDLALAHTSKTFQSLVSPSWLLSPPNPTSHPVNGKTKRVLTLEYEAYTPMALQETSRLCTLARTKWPALLHLAVQHRIGSCPVGEDSVCVATSSPHRRDALEACAWLIDELKASVPVWKKEVYEDGTKSWKANCECTRKMGPPPGVEV
ncbi:Molybdopterin synthase catalytic subunit [Quaeritorhiza haematococci]|nr:Molybdopterin synthase catalytic subunit [Quaeritorhiza haematococci]